MTNHPTCAVWGFVKMAEGGFRLVASVALCLAVATAFQHAEAADILVLGADTFLRPEEIAILPESGMVGIFDCSGATHISETSTCGGTDFRVITQDQRAIECKRKDADKMKKLVNNSLDADKLRQILRQWRGEKPRPDSEYWLLADVLTQTPPVTRKVWCGGCFSRTVTVALVISVVVTLFVNYD